MGQSAMLALLMNTALLIALSVIYELTYLVSFKYHRLPPMNLLELTIVD